MQYVQQQNGANQLEAWQYAQKWIYTAVTRASHYCMITSSREALS
jgi:hypothetical protein